MKLTKYLLCCLCILFISGSISFGRNYYVDPSHTSIQNDGTFSSPWKSVEDVSKASRYFLPGDTVFFRKSQTYEGRLSIFCSGTESAPIVFTSYGNGPAPRFNNNYRDIITVYDRQYIVIDGFNITDTEQEAMPKSVAAKMSYAIIIDNSPFCTIKNCTISFAGIGIELKPGSDHTLIEKNVFSDLRMVINTEGGEDDFGATPIVVSSSGNKILKNQFDNCWGSSFDFDFDGGAVQLFGESVSNNFIAYNTAVNCYGFLKVGSAFKGTVDKNTIAYNKIINCGNIAILLNDGRYTVAIKDLAFYNNTIVETATFFSRPGSFIWAAKDLSPESFILRNNIFWLATGIRIINDKVLSSSFIHTNNIYRAADSVDILLDKTEKSITNDTVFKNITGNPSQWDFTLKKRSLAMNFGIDVGLQVDFGGDSIIDLPDAGIYEYTSPLLVASFDSLRCFGDSANVILSAQNGYPPYTGIGNFRLVAGNHILSVTDQKGRSDTLFIAIKQPPPLVLNGRTPLISNYWGSTYIEIKAEGGVSPYLYSFNGSGFSAVNRFTGLFAGDYILSVKDFNGCKLQLKQTIKPYIPTLFSENRFTKLRVFPNPSYSHFTLNNKNYYDIDRYIDLSVYDSRGFLVFYKKGAFSEFFSFGSDFTTGHYYVYLKTGNATKTMVIVKH